MRHERNDTAPPNLLEDLREVIGCHFISELPAPPHGRNVMRELAQLQVERYSLPDWSDAIDYLLKEKHQFASHEEVTTFLSGLVVC